MSNSSADRVFEAADGILGVRMPMPPPLEWVNAYFLRDGAGWTMVDTGYNTPESRTVLQDVIAHHLDGKPITRLVATHYHPDHAGQAGWIVNNFKCHFVMTETEWNLARWLGGDQSGSYVNMMLDYYRRAGTPEPLVDAITSRGNNYTRTCDDIPDTYTRVADHDILYIDEQPWRVVVGRGHAPEMIMLYSDARKILISADQVVARITPNVSVWPFDIDANPLRDFIHTCTTLPERIPNDVTILPGHGRPFDDFHARVASYNTFHENRLNKLWSGMTDGDMTLYELHKILFPRELTPRDFVFALGETHSHINYLVSQGRALRVDTARFLFRRVAAA